MRKVVKRSSLSPTEARMKTGTPVEVARASRAIVSLLAGLAILGLLGCTNVETVQQYEGAPLPRPDRLLVYEFAYSPSQVKLDPGVSPEFEPETASSLTAQQLEVGRRLSKVLAEHLVKEFRDMGLAAFTGFGTSPSQGNTYSIEGQFLSIDLGNRTQRVEVGLGRTQVKTLVQLYRDSGDGKLLLETLDVVAKGAGNKPFGADVEADAVHTAVQVAKKLRAFFVQQGWISR
jgi:hypothetical protein